MLAPKFPVELFADFASVYGQLGRGLPGHRLQRLGVTGRKEDRGAQIDGIGPKGQSLQTFPRRGKSSGDNQADFALRAPKLKVPRGPGEADNGRQSEVIFQNWSSLNCGSLGPLQGQIVDARLQTEIDFPLQIV